MKKTITLLSAIIFCVSAVFAQDYSFKVLASKGVAQVDNGSGWKLLKSGSKLNKKNKVKVAQGSYVGLMHTSGKTIELKTPGTYEVANLSGKLNNSKSSFTSKYASFVLNQPSSDEAKQKYNVTGSVSRGAGDVEILTTKKIKVYPKIPVTIAWDSKEEKGFVVSIVSLFGKTIFTTETDNKFVELDLKDMELEDDAYAFRVALKSEPTKYEQKALEILDPKMEVEVIENVSKLAEELDQNSPMDQLTMASYFEEQGLTTYALSSLSKANNLAPEVEDFKILRKQYYFTKSEEK